VSPYENEKKWGVQGGGEEKGTDRVRELGTIDREEMRLRNKVRGREHAVDL